MNACEIRNPDEGGGVGEGGKVEEGGKPTGLIYYNG